MPRQARAAPGARKTTRRASELSYTIGCRIRAARNARGWSLTRLAEESGVHPATIRTYELGERELPLKVIPLLAAGLGLPVKVILGATTCPSCGEKPPPCRNCGGKPWPKMTCLVCGETGR